MLCCALKNNTDISLFLKLFYLLIYSVRSGRE